MSLVLLLVTFDKLSHEGGLEVAKLATLAAVQCHQVVTCMSIYFWQHSSCSSFHTNLFCSSLQLKLASSPWSSVVLSHTHTDMYLHTNWNRFKWDSVEFDHVSHNINHVRKGVWKFSNQSFLNKASVKPCKGMNSDNCYSWVSSPGV